MSINYEAKAGIGFEIRGIEDDVRFEDWEWWVGENLPSKFKGCYTGDHWLSGPEYYLFINTSECNIIKDISDLAIEMRQICKGQGFEIISDFDLHETVYVY